MKGRKILNPKHLAEIRELNKHPLNQAALQWLEEGEKQKVSWTMERAMGVEAVLGPEPYYLHALCLLEWAMDETPLPPQRREALEHHLDLLESDPKEGIEYLLSFPGDGEPTMLTEKLQKAESLEEAGLTILGVFQLILTDDPLLDFPPWERPFMSKFTGPIWGPDELKPHRSAREYRLKGYTPPRRVLTQQ